MRERLRECKRGMAKEQTAPKELEGFPNGQANRKRAGLEG